MRLLSISAVTAAVALAGCTTDPMTGQRDYNKTAIGALTGAAAGALIAKSNGDKDKMGQAAAIGAVLGGGVGYYYNCRRWMIRTKIRATTTSFFRLLVFSFVVSLTHSHRLTID